MSIITLSHAKAFLDVIHSADDAKLQDLLDAAEDEAVQYMGRGLLEPVPAAKNWSTACSHLLHRCQNHRPAWCWV